MKTENLLHLERKNDLLTRVPFSRSTLYTRINQKLFVPPVSLGGRAVGFISTEVDQCIAAMIAGKTNEELQEIVAELVKKRQSALEGLK